MEAKLGDLQLTVYDLIRLAGWEGKTTDEIEAETGLTHQSASARVNELANWKENGKEKPLIERRGITRKTRAGRGAGVYVLAGLTPANVRVQQGCQHPGYTLREHPDTKEAAPWCPVCDAFVDL